MTTNPSAISAAWPCIAIIAMPAAIATVYDEVSVQIPMFRCGQCRRLTDGMTLLGDEMRYQRFFKKTVTLPSVWPRRD